MSFELKYQNYINGVWCDSESKDCFTVADPADLRRICHSYPRSVPGDMNRAIEGARSAFQSWSGVSLAEKSGIMRRASNIIQENREQIARVITETNGKLLSESMAEIDAAVLELEYQIGEGERQFGQVGDGYGTSIMGYSRKEPLGVISAIIPWNFPFNIPFRKLVPALMAGNTAILKPASQTAAVGELVLHIFVAAGVPAGVLQFVTGSGSTLSQSLVAHKDIKAVTFTGSTEVGRKIANLAAKNFTRTQLEMGGKNPMLVLQDADLNAAADAVVVGAFSCAGQWCTATSRLIIEESIADALVDKVVAKTSQLRLGPGIDSTSSMGPVCGQHQLNSVLRHIEQAESEGARLLMGGCQTSDNELTHGCYVMPTIFEDVDEGMSLSQEEVFGPVLAIMRVSDYEEGLALANAVPYGLSSSIFTNDLDKALHFVEHTEVGLTHVNVHSAYKEPQHCFGGYKCSGFGLPEAGRSGIEFFQAEKSVYINKNGA